MSKFFTWAVAVALCVALTSSPALAKDKKKGEKGDKVASQFKKLDTNKDGSLSLEEFKASMEKKDEKKGEKKKAKKDKN